MSSDVTDKGLEGVVALSSSVSSIVDGVLTYRGYNIDDLTEHTTYEEVAYLLLHDDLPNASQLAEFKNALNQRRAVPAAALKTFHDFPKAAQPMEMLRTAVSLLGMFDSSSNDVDLPSVREKSLRLVAQFPTLIAALDRIRRGKEPVAPHPTLDTAANFLYMMHGIEPDKVAVEALDKALILHADHELNASTFAARQTVSTLADIYSAVTTAIGTLKGPLHGGANEAVIRMLKEIGSPDKLDAYLDNALEKKVKIMGFGHRVYKDGDPRAKHLKKMSKELGALIGQTQWYEMSERLEALILERKGLKANVDFYSASVYHSLGISIDLYTPIFALSRISGWLAHILEQYGNNRLIRPRADYTGPVHRTVKPISER